MDAFGILGQVNIAAGATYEVLYTVPSIAQTTYSSGNILALPAAEDRVSQVEVTSLIVCNTSGSADTYSIRLLPTAATTPAAKHSLFVATAIAANATHVINMGLVLAPDNTIEVTCATTNRCSFTLMGIVVT